MFVLQAEITIGNYVFRQVNHVKIESSWKTLGDTAMIKLPNLAEQLENGFQVGDPVSIKLGYEDVYFDEEFNGFISKVSPNIPYTIECEDHIYHAKRTNVSKLFKSTTLKEIVKFLIEEMNDQQGTFITATSNIPDVSFDKFRINNLSVAGALKKLKEDYGMISYFTGSKLFVGLPLTDIWTSGAVVNYSTSWNIIKPDLTFVKDSDRNLRIKAISILPDNSKLEVEVGDPDGELRTLFFYKISSKTELTDLANTKLQSLKYSGFEGSFSTFFVPVAHHSMVANIKDPDYNEGRAGNYLIDSVTKEFGMNGARRKVELGVQL